MPGLDYFSNTAATTSLAPAQSSVATAAPRSDVYYNARLDPKNYLEGPLSPYPSTRLRQMLARPGIVVSSVLLSRSSTSRLSNATPLGSPRYL